MKRSFVLLFLLANAFLTIGLMASSLSASQRSSKSGDITNPLLEHSSKSSSGSYRPLGQSGSYAYDEEEAKATDQEAPQQPVPEPAQHAWMIPRSQFDLGIPIYGTIFAFMIAWGEDDALSLVMRAVYAVSFLVSVQIYFGFYLSCHRGGCCGFLPSVSFNRINFPRTDFDVSFGRWISGPLSWISEVFSFMPPEGYRYLQENAYFPERSIVHLIFMIQLLYYFGIYDMYRNHLMPA